MRWLLLLFLIGCQQDEITFRTIKRSHQENSQNDVQFVQKKDDHDCPQKCNPPSMCDRTKGRCTGAALKKEDTNKIDIRQGDTTLVFDNTTGRLYGKSHENY